MHTREVCKICPAEHQDFEECEECIALADRTAVTFRKNGETLLPAECAAKGERYSRAHALASVRHLVQSHCWISLLLLHHDSEHVHCCLRASKHRDMHH